MLTPSYSYAIRVKAEDPTGKANFRNNGYSEVSYFVYGKKLSTITPIFTDIVTTTTTKKTIQFTTPKGNHKDSTLSADTENGFFTAWLVLPAGYSVKNNVYVQKNNQPIDGELLANPLIEYPDGQFKVQFFDSPTANLPIYESTTEKIYLNISTSDQQLPFETGNSYWVKTTIENKSTKKILLESDRVAFKYELSPPDAYEARTVSGTLKYMFENKGNNSYPIDKCEIQLQCAYLITDIPTGFQYEIPEAVVVKAMSHVTDFPSDLTKTIVSNTQTSLSGAFNFQFYWKKNILLGEISSTFNYISPDGKNLSGPLSRVLRVVIQNPYYAPPQTIIYNNLSNNALGEIKTYVYSYELKADITKGYAQSAQAKENLVNKTIFLYRKKKNQGIPLYEVNRLTNIILSPSEINAAGYYFVGSTKTVEELNENGKKVTMVKFSRLIENLTSGDEYYWYAEGSGIATSQVLKFTGSNVLPTSPNESTERKTYFLDKSGSGYKYAPTSGKANNTQSTHSASVQSTSTNIVTEGAFMQLGNITSGFDVHSNLADGAQSNVKITSTGNYSFLAETSLNVITNDPPMSRIKGRLVYDFKNKPGNLRPLSNKSVSIISCLVTDEPGQISKFVYTANNKCDHVSVLKTSTTDADGNFNFEFPNFGYGTTSSIMVSSGTYYTSTGNLNHDMQWRIMEGTDKQFEIVYEPRTIKVKRVLRIVVNDASRLFLSPDNDLDISPLETADVGMLTSYVMSYKLKGGVSWDMPNPNTSANYLNLPISTPIKGVECYALRKKTDISLYQLPPEEGMNIVGSLDEMSNYKIIAKSVSGNSGEFSFDNLLFLNSAAPLYMYYRTMEMLNDANFHPLLVSQSKMNAFAPRKYIFNADFNYISLTDFNAKMEPRAPTLKGKVTSNVKAGFGLADANATVMFTFKETVKFHTLKTDHEGYFDFSQEFKLYEKWIKENKLIEVVLFVSKSGFHYMENNVRKSHYKNTFDYTKFTAGTQVVLPNILLYASGSITGKVVNETQNPIDAYLLFKENSSQTNLSGGEGDMIQNNNANSLILPGTFNISAIPGYNRQLIIIPKDVAYFPDTITLNVSSTNETSLGNITVFERSHRIRFKVRHVSNPQAPLIMPLAGAKVSMIGSPTPVEAVSGSDGTVNLKFKNVSETNLSMKVTGPAGSNYVPKVVSFTNYESDHIVTLPDVILEKGLTVKGKVLLDGKPTRDAEVYVELFTSQTGKEIETTSEGESASIESEHLYKAFPNAEGIFEINTIPPELKNQQIYIKAVYRERFSISMGRAAGSSSEEKFTVVGDEKNVVVPNTSGTLTLNMTTYKDMFINDILGFPVEITKITPTSNQQVYVSGRIQLNEFSPGFDPLETLTLEVDNILMKPGSLNINKTPIAVPATDNIYINTKRSLKMKYGKSYNVKMSAPGNSLLSIAKDLNHEGKGLVNVTVSIVDNSFEYPSSYLNFEGVNFYFCHTTGQQTTSGGTTGGYQASAQSSYLSSVSPVIPAFKSAVKGNGNNLVKFNLCNLNQYGLPVPLNFKFINFSASSEISGSTIEGAEITLAPTLNAKVKSAGDVTVKIEKLVLKNNQVMPSTSNEAIWVNLKDEGIYDATKAWKFEVKNWTIDPKEGGIYSKNVVLHTGIIDVPFKTFNLRSDFAYIGDPVLTNLNAAGYPIKVSAGAETKVGYNPSCGSDKKGHWQLIIFPNKNGDVPAKIENLPNMGGTALELETISLLSNGDHVFSIGTGAGSMHLYNTVRFKPQTMFTLPDGLVLSGNANFMIPRVRSNVGVKLLFSKSAPLSINPAWDPIDLAFDGRGNIVFKTLLNAPTFANPSPTSASQSFSSSPGKFITYGTIAEPGVLEPVYVKLTYFANADNSKIRTEIVQSDKHSSQKIKIGEENSRLENISCKTQANQTDWDLFTFAGDLTGVNGVASDAKKRIEFTVHGEIKANHSGFKADGISTPFGNIDITYQKGRMIGSLTMNKVPLGCSQVSGVANLLMDSKGWAFYAACTGTNVPLPDKCTANLGLLIGNHSEITPEMQSTVLTYAINKQLPDAFKNSGGLRGFFIVAGRDLPIAGLDIDYDFLVAKAYVKVPIAALNGMFWLNTVNGMNFGLGMAGKLKFDCLLRSITCTGIGGGIDFSADIMAQYNNGNPSLSSSNSLNGYSIISQGVPALVGCIDALDFRLDLGAKLDWSLPPFKVKFEITEIKPQF